MTTTRERALGSLQPAVDGISGGSEYEVEERIHQRLIRDLDDSVLRNPDRDVAREQVTRAAQIIATDLYPGLAGDSKEEVITRVVDEVVGLGPIEPLLRDGTISEIMINAPDEVYFERDGIVQASAVRFRDEAHIMRIIDRIVASIGRHVDEASPMVDARLHDGSRVNVILPPLVPRGPVVTIRRFLGDRYTIEDLSAIGTLTPEMAALLDACVKTRLSLVISGGTGSGKTTLLNAVSSSIPDKERIVTIEDPIELQLQQRHTISAEARPPSTEGRGEVTQRMLLRNALRMRPDRIVIGEVRGDEAFDMLQAMNTGHDGSLTTVHANSPRDALSRIENMVLMAGFDLPVTAIREQMASAFHVVVQLSRMPDGSRKIVSIAEVTGTEGPTITLQELFAFKQTGIGEQGQVLGQMEPKGIRPGFADHIRSYGLELPDSLFGVGRWN